MLSERVLDILPRGRPDGFHVGGLHGGNRGEFFIDIAAGEGGVIGAAVVVGGTGDGVEGVDDVRVGCLLTVTLGQTVCCARLALDDIEGTVRHVAGKALAQRAIAGARRLV